MGYKIVADSVEVFNKIKEKIDILPKAISDQVYKAEGNFSLIYLDLFQGHSDIIRVYLPREVHELEINNTGFIAYSTNMVIRGNKTEDQRFNFSFIK